MENDKEQIVILGFGGHAKSVADSIIRTNSYIIAGYTDIHQSDCHYNYLGDDDILEKLFHQGIHKAVLGVGYMGGSTIRDSLVQRAKEIGFEFPIIVDPSAIIASDAVIGEGSFIGKNSIVNADSKIGNYCILNTGTIVEHENEIGEYSHVAVGAILCGNVKIGHHSIIGAGATIIQGKSVGNNAIIGANSTVNSDISNDCIAVGSPAKVLKNNK